MASLRQRGRFPSTIRLVVSAIVLIVPTSISGQLSPNAYGQTSADGFAGVAAQHLSSAQSQMSALKPAIFNSVLALQKDILDAQEQSASWAKIAHLESDAHMRSVSFAFRDGFQSHGQNLTQIQQLVIDLGHLGERLEATLKELVAVQQDIEAMAMKQARVSANDIKVRLLISQSELKLATQQLVASKDQLAREVSSLKKYDSQVREILASIGTPQTDAKKWEKEVVETELKHDADEAMQLKNVGLLGVRMSQLLQELAETLLAQQQAVNSL